MRMLVAAFFAHFCCFSFSAAEQPNIVFMLADDTGFGDFACTGHPYAKTPTIDQLARDGAIFKNFYVGGATCCPSRTAFMTGRFPASFQKYPATFGFSGAITITDLLKENGYRTGHFGKWHMGDEQKAGTFGIETINVSGGNRKDTRGRDSEIADHTIEFIRANKDKPFYVNVWWHTVHNPVNPPQAFVDRFKDVIVKVDDFKNPDMREKLDEYKKAGEDIDLEMRKHLGDVLQLDEQVARVLKTIDDLGLRKNTIVIFVGDNGPNKYGSAGPYRAAKHSLYDGGIHQPLIVRWPGHVKEGRVDEQSVLAGVDWLPTLCSIAGIKIDAAKFVGEDVSDIWQGKQRERTNDLFWKASNPRDTPVMRRGNWKLHMPVKKKGEIELYDVIKDPAERENVAKLHPDVVKEMSAALKRWNDSLPTSYEKADEKD